MKSFESFAIGVLLTIIVIGAYYGYVNGIVPFNFQKNTPVIQGEPSPYSAPPPALPVAASPTAVTIVIEPAPSVQALPPINTNPPVPSAPPVSESTVEMKYTLTCKATGVYAAPVPDDRMKFLNIPAQFAFVIERYTEDSKWVKLYNPGASSEWWIQTESFTYCP